MIFLFPKEQLLLEIAIKKNPQHGEDLAEAIKKIYVHLPAQVLSGRYDAALAGEFLKELLKDAQKRGVEKYDSMVTEDETAHTLGEKCLAPQELQEGVLKSLGSHGLTALIRDMLEKMSKDSYDKTQIEHLTELISTRNAMRQNEERFLEEAFRSYLKKQITLHKAEPQRG